MAEGGLPGFFTTLFHQPIRTGRRTKAVLKQEREAGIGDLACNEARRCPESTFGKVGASDPDFELTILGASTLHCRSNSWR